MRAVLPLLAVACASSAPPMRAGGPADPHAAEAPMAAASPELTADSGIARYDSGSTPMMGNMQMGGMQHDMPGMADGGTPKKKPAKMHHQEMQIDGGMGDMSGMDMDGGME